eukprot:gnl/MRDRNA2_/MRDRNA2_35844_c0_seq1.p1 gnl/MRDRNA2_/MRDRNA2_35844_c0~~gnl/MRDRNA2_/MRDRNA2_35844_c0_seq1.p1  ORF type:complete len:310 (+),score=52.49 gnl/MRDRNA2_/MRDRNA2_35844_c0_seq1:90-1019(+)
MRPFTEIILLAFIVRALATEPVTNHRGDVRESLDEAVDNFASNKVFKKLLRVLPFEGTNLDRTTVGKPHSRAILSRYPSPSRPRVSSHHSITSFHRRGPLSNVPAAATLRGHSFRIMAATSQAEKLLDEGKTVYMGGDRGQALNIWERALQEDDIPKEVQQELLYSCLAACAASGDIEASKMYVREMTESGLSYEKAMSDPSFMRMEASAFMRKQLKSFVAGNQKSLGTIQREIYQAKEKEKAASGEGKPRTGDGVPSTPLIQNLDPSDDGIDFSYVGIARRVAGLVVAAVVLYGILFVIGFQFLNLGD